MRPTTAADIHAQTFRVIADAIPLAIDRDNLSALIELATLAQKTADALLRVATEAQASMGQGAKA